MIVCTKCGFRNDASAEFCGSCGSFLEWTGAKVEASAETLPPPEAPVAEIAAERHGLMDRVREVVGLGGAAGAIGAAGSATPAAGAEPLDQAGPAGGAVGAGHDAGLTSQAGPAANVVRGSRVYRVVEEGPDGGAFAPTETGGATAPAASEPPEHAAPPPSAAPAPAPLPPTPPVELAPEPPTPAPAPVPAWAAAPFAAPPAAAPSPGAPFAPPATGQPGVLFAPPPVAPLPPFAPAIAPAAWPPAAGQPGAAPPEPALPVPAPTPAEPAGSPAAAPGPTAAAPQTPTIRPVPLAPARPNPEPPAPLIRPAKPGIAPARRPLVEAAPSGAAEIPMAKPAPAQPAPPPTQPAAARPVAGMSPTRRPAGAAIGPSPAQAAAAQAAAGAGLPGAAGQPPSVVPTDQPASRQPTAVKPTIERPRTAPRPAATDTPAPNPGDLVCGNCGMGNDPARKFCRRCGQSLATATVAAAPRVPWYRKLFRRAPKQPLAAGQRPKALRTDAGGGRGSAVNTFGHYLTRALQLVAILALVGGAVGLALFPNVRDVVSGFIAGIVGTVIPKTDPVSTVGTATGSGLKNHAPQLMFDGTQGYWAAAFTTNPPVQASSGFAPPATINKVRFISGASDNFAADARPRNVTLEFLGAAGGVVATKDYELKDTHDPQDFDAGAKGVIGLRLTVKSIFPAADPKAPVAITEVQFFGAVESAIGSPAPSP